MLTPYARFVDMLMSSATPSAATTESLGVLDGGALMRLSELDPKGQGRLLERVLKTYQVSVARLMPQLHAARRDHDLDGIRYVAHTLKSSSASIGAVTLAALCSEIEALTLARSTNGVDTRVDSMIEEVEIVLKTIARLLDSMQ